VNKKKQKNFNRFWPTVFPTPREAEQKSFLVLFFKKELLSFYKLYNRNPEIVNTYTGFVNFLPALYGLLRRRSILGWHPHTRGPIRKDISR
jgi:hypothetical protein